MSKVYVGTYAKYNSGSLFGEWVDLTQFNNEDDFQEYINELHKDEADPEFMFQDFEDFPREFYSESGIDSDVFEWLQLDDNQKEIYSAFVECFGAQKVFDYDEVESAYHGQFNSDLDFAYDFIDSTGMLHGVPESIQNYFDYDKFSRDLTFDYVENNGHYFNRNW